MGGVHSHQDHSQDRAGSARPVRPVDTAGGTTEERDSVHSEAPHPRVATRTAKPRLRPVGGTRVPGAASPAQWNEQVLPTADFAATVHREIRRSERSGLPLSVVQYTVDPAAADEPVHFERLYAVLQHGKRDTDMLGLTGVDTLTILCPDTGADGAACLVAKLAPYLADVPATSMIASYPDDLFESLRKSSPTNALFQSSMVPDEPLPGMAHYPLKAAIDFVLALFALVVFSPLMLVVALVVKLTSEGPVIFKQPRLGRGGIPFTFYKFRSMVVTVDDRIHREYMAKLIRAGHGTAPEQDAGTVTYKMVADPRITRIGRFIRATSIDELPQLFNVLKGDMSMVGPRPPIPYEAAHYEPWHLQRILSAKPGITGLWQVEGRSRVTFSEMVRMDLHYIRHCSFALDIKLLFRTIAVVLRRDGAR